jgi:putative hydrolase of the HAD superfamily
MIPAPFDHIDTWVFDLDNTLYPPSIRLFDQIEVRMTAYVMQALRVARDEADHLRDLYWKRHGTTLAGLMREHGVDPLPYLRDVHDIDFAAVTPDPQLTAGIARLPGRRIVYTNGSADYAHQVIAARGLTGLFDAVYGIAEAGFHPKPDRAAYEAVFARDGLAPVRAAMFEDDARNLAVPHAMGLATVHVAPDPDPQPFIQHHTSDLTAFLTRLTTGLPATG